MIRTRPLQKNSENIEKKYIYKFWEQKDTQEKAEEQIANGILNKVLYEHE